MSETAKLKVNGKEYEFPLLKGTENELAIDIKSLRAATEGVITLDSGYKNTGSCESAVTFLDGEKGILRYRGYSIEELASKSNFLESSYLLIFGELPTAVELKKFHDDILAESLVDEDIKKILDGFPKSANPMGVVSALTSSLIAFNPESVNIESSEDMYDAIVKLLAKFPVLAAWTLRKKQGLPLDYGDVNLGYVENMYKMMFSKPNCEFKANPV
ncbi:MAG: citrate/2-methylcitrate synthase, partial [Flavicella sp.]|nr:citrate/2-methylcitrate synthase [Flavicella sp.]